MLTEWSPLKTTGSASAARKARTGLDVRGLDGVGVDDVGVADVDDRTASGRSRIVLVVVGTAVAEEKSVRLSTAAAEARAGAELRADVEGGAEHRYVGVDRGPVLDVGALPKVEMPTKGRFRRPVS